MLERKSAGFTLVELMIALVVLAVLTAVAYPMYQDQVRKSRRAAVKGALLQLSQFMEHNYTENLRYHTDGAGNSIDFGYVMDTPFFAGEKERMTQYYDLSLSFSADNSVYTITAAPKTNQSSDKCGTLVITSTGNRTAADTGCW